MSTPDATAGSQDALVRRCYGLRFNVATLATGMSAETLAACLQSEESLGMS